MKRDDEDTTTNRRMVRFWFRFGVRHANILGLDDLRLSALSS
jgi:hypothetical protein